MSKKSRKALPKPPTENLKRGNVKPASRVQADFLIDWLNEQDMQHTMKHVPSEEWDDEEWRYYWKTIV